MLAISLIIACLDYRYDGVILHAHPVRGESHNQRNTAREVATVAWFPVNTSAKYYHLTVGTQSQAKWAKVA